MYTAIRLVPGPAATGHTPWNKDARCVWVPWCEPLVSPSLPRALSLVTPSSLAPPDHLVTHPFYLVGAASPLH